MRYIKTIELILTRLLWATIASLIVLIVMNCTLFMLIDYGHMEHGAENFVTTIFSPIIYFLTIGLSFASVGTFITWFYVVYINLIRYGADLQRSVGTALISWFIPIYNFVAPLFLMKKVFRETNRLLGKKESETGLRESLLDGWWFLAITTIVFVIIEVAFSLRSSTSSGLFKAELIGTVCQLVSAFLCTQIVKLYGKAESELKKINTP